MTGRASALAVRRRLGRDVGGLSGDLPARLPVGALLGAGALVFGRRQRLARGFGQVAFTGLPAVAARLGAPVLALPLQEVIVGRLGPEIAAAAALVGLDRELGLAGRPLAGLAALGPGHHLGLHLVPELGIGP